MKTSVRTSAVSFAFLLAAAVLAAGCDVTIGGRARYVEREQKDFQVSGIPDLVISTFDGSIELRSWDRPEVSIEVEKRGPTKEVVDQIEVSATQSGNSIKVEVRLPSAERRRFRFSGSRSAHLTVSVPRATNITARSGDGTITIERVNGRVDLNTGDGMIRVTEVTGDLKLHTGDGSLRLERVDGRVDAETGDGTIEVRGRFEALKLRTGDGRVVVRADAGSRMAENWEVQTGDGSVGLELPEPFDADLDVSTHDGRVSVTDLTVKGDVSRRSVRGQLGAGGRTLRVTSGDGVIMLSRS